MSFGSEGLDDREVLASHPGTVPRNRAGQSWVTCLQCRINSPSKPAAIAADAARRNSSTTPAISSIGSAIGTGMSCSPEAVNIAPLGWMADGARG
jgi:hypothetical protein